MKKLSLLLLVASVALFSCKDKGTDDPNGGDAAPTSYTQKVLIEYFSGAWCQFCPDGKVYSDNIEAKYGAGVSTVVYHLGDAMDNIFDDAIDDKYAAGYPTGMINRIGGVAANRGTWDASTAAVMAEVAKCGLSIDASDKNGTNLTVKVNLGIGANDMPEGNYFLTVLVVEDEMSGTGTGWDQANYYNGVSGHPYYGKGSPIVGYKHTNVVRNVLTAALGDKLTAGQVAAGTLSEFEFTTNLGGLGDDLDIVAFISEATNNLQNPALSSSYIYNVQRVDVGTTQAFD
ncbi:MAG: Omp28-related outer membrane protein [Bacteroidia bacterium]